MPSVHLFATSTMPFWFTLSFLIASYYKNKKQRCGFIVHISRSIHKNAQRFIYHNTVTAQSVKKEFKILCLLQNKPT